MNVENHDPKNWSYFRKLAEEQFSGVDTKRHHVAALTRDGITAENSVDPQLNVGQDFDYVAGTDEDAQMKVTESEEFGAIVENLRTLDFEHEVYIRFDY